MLGLIGTVGGAVALEIRRIRKKGGPDEVREVKQRERELRELLEATNQELARAQKQNELAESKAQQLQEEKLHVEKQAAELGKQKHQLQQNNTKLVLTNIMLANKAKHLEDSSRALVAKQEDLQHQLESLQRERQAELEASEATLAALKDQVTAVLNRYLSKDCDLQEALQEMQALGIELVPLDPQDGSPDDVVEFESKFVLESPHRMQRLMNAAAGRIFLTAGQEGQDVPMLSFPMGIGKDPTTGMPRVSLGWRHEPQGGPASLMGSSSDAEQKDQQPSTDNPARSLMDKSSSTSVAAAAAAPSSGSTLLTMEAEADALTFTSGAKKQQSSGSSGGFSLGFGSIGRISMRGSSGGGSSAASKGVKGTAAPTKPPVIPGALLGKVDAGDDDIPAFSSTSLTTR